MEIYLKSEHDKYVNQASFKHATDGSDSDFPTFFTVSYDAGFLKIDFECHDNYFTTENTYTKDNTALFNQEVFEVFISTGHVDPPRYLEIEINPNNAVWIGEIDNPELGGSEQRIKRMISPSDSGLKHNVEIGEKSWHGYLHLPWTLIGSDPEGRYRLNFYRIRSRVSHPVSDWECDKETCDFVCWQSSLSGEVPAFHRPKRFGLLKLDLSS